MLVKESGDLSLQLGCLTQLTHGDGVLKELALNICGQIIPLHDDSGPQAPQNMLLFLAEGRNLVAMFLRRPLGRPALVIPPGDRLLIRPAGMLRFFSAHLLDMVRQTERFHNCPRRDGC
jgi:hypothetical protein